MLRRTSLIQLLLIIVSLQASLAQAFGKKYYIQLGSCYLQKCVNANLNAAQPYGWPLTVHRVSLTKQIYHIQSSMWHDETNVDVYVTELAKHPKLADKVEMLGTDAGYFISLGYFDDTVKAYKTKSLAEQILAEDKVRFAMKRLTKKEESSKVLVGPFNTEKAAHQLKQKIRATPEFPHAFVVFKE